jgi:DNA-directed RNA polymerase subunit RPC12/RpoP
MQLTVDSPLPILHLISEVKLTIDPRYRGELRRFTENAGLRCNYFNKAKGVTVDSFGELLWDRGLVSQRPTEREVLDLLETVFSAVDRKVTHRAIETDSNANGSDLEAELEKARKNRNRLFVCPCSNSIRSASLTLRIRCEDCDSRFIRTERTVAEIKLGVSLAVIASPDYKAVELENAPF